MGYLSRVIFCLFLGVLAFTPLAEAREINYYGGEVKVYVQVGEPTVVSFPSEIEGGYRSTNSQLDLERRGTDLIVFAKPGLAIEGEVLVIYVKDKRPFMIRVMPAKSP